MFEITGNKVLEMQLKAAETEAFEILTDSEEDITSRSNCLRQVVQMKERAARFVIEELESLITRFTARGVSSVSLAAIAEAYQKALESSVSQMQIFANELSKLTHNDDIKNGYGAISESLVSYMDNLIRPLKESKGKALEGLDGMIFAEIYETWRNLENRPS